MFGTILPVTINLQVKLLAWGLFLISLFCTFVYIWIDYRRHRRPLAQYRPNVHYTFPHHIRIVIIPKVQYVLRERVHIRHRQ